jgi:protein-disulfide isomerase
MNTTAWATVLAKPVEPGRDHIRGDARAAVTLVEYGDYECPYCRNAHGVVAALERQLLGQMSFVYRHFPLVTLHPHAQSAAEAAESAGRQQKFWPMHDSLFTAQKLLSYDFLISAARTLGLDERSFDSELTGHLHLPRIRDDFMSGVRSGVNGTPAFYINGVRHAGAWDFESLLTALYQATARGVKLMT